MARIPAITTIDPKPWQVIQGPACVKIGAVSSNNPHALGATLASVGLTEGSVEFNPNIETAILTSDQMFNPHGVIETAWAYQVTLSLDQKTIWNLALALSYDQSAVTASSMLTLDAQQPSSYRCMQIIAEGTNESADATPVTTVENTDLWKVKIVPSGAIVRGRTAKTTIPIIAHAVANHDDVVGLISVVPGDVVKPLYE